MEALVGREHRVESQFREIYPVATQQHIVVLQMVPYELGTELSDFPQGSEHLSWV
jgi:hypothetical protein